MSEPLGKLVQGLDKAVLANKEAGLRFVGDLSERGSAGSIRRW